MISEDAKLFFSMRTDRLAQATSLQSPPAALILFSALLENSLA